MADEEAVQESASEQATAEEGGASKKKGLPWGWIALAVVVVVFSALGFGVGRWLGTPKTAEAEEAEPAQEIQLPEYMTLLDQKGDPKATWFYEVEPVVANLNDPGASRYIRVAFALEINGKMPQDKTTEYLNKKSYILKDHIGKYLATQSLKDLQGDRNLERVPMELKDLLNATLFPDMEPVIVNILYRERAIQ